MTKSKLPKTNRNKHVNKNVWKHVKYKSNDEGAPFSIGQILHVYPQGTDLDWIPCIPKPGSEHNVTRLAYQREIMFTGMIEFIGGTKSMCFMIFDDGKIIGEVLLGLGTLPHLCNVPKRPTKGLASAPKTKHPPGSGRGGKKSPARLAKLQARKRADAKILHNQTDENDS